MPLGEVLTELPLLSREELAKVRALLDHLTGLKSGETDEGPGEAKFASDLWDAVCFAAKRKGFAYPTAYQVLRGRQRKTLIEGSRPIAELFKRVGTNPNHLRFIVLFAFGQILEQQNNAKPEYILACIKDFPYYLETAFPGISNPSHFRTMYKLYMTNGGENNGAIA